MMLHATRLKSAKYKTHVIKELFLICMSYNKMNHLTAVISRKIDSSCSKIVVHLFQEVFIYRMSFTFS